VLTTIGENDRTSTEGMVMVMVTDRARVALRGALSRSIDDAEVGLRLDVSDDGGLALYPDRAKAGDEIVKHEGNVLLVISDDISRPLDGATIDVAETPEGDRLVVSTPAVSPDGAS
jgi:Fe-S cluster assembly iron-binding protein IscA